MFCGKCGTPVSNAAPVNIGQPYAQPYNAAYAQPQQRKKLSTRAAVAIVASVAVVVIAAVVVFFLFFSKSDGGTSPSVLTVNGESISLELAGFAYTEVDMGDYGYAAVFLGRKGSELYCVQAVFSTDMDPSCPSANTTYDPLNSKYNAVFVKFAYMDTSKGKEAFAESDANGFDRVEIVMGDFKPKEKMEISVSGKASDDGLTFDFSASGNMEYFSDSDELYDKLDSIVASVYN